MSAPARNKAANAALLAANPLVHQDKKTSGQGQALRYANLESALALSRNRSAPRLIAWRCPMRRISAATLLLGLLAAPAGAQDHRDRGKWGSRRRPDFRRRSAGSDSARRWRPRQGSI